MEVSAKTKKHPTPVKINYNVPEKLAELQKAFGDDVVAAHASGSIVISLQAAMRRLIEKGKNATEIQAALKDWKPGVRDAVKMSAFDKASSAIEKLSDAERADLLKRLSSGGAPAAAPKVAVKA